MAILAEKWSKANILLTYLLTMSTTGSGIATDDNNVVERGKPLM